MIHVWLIVSLCARWCSVLSVAQNSLSGTLPEYLTALKRLVVLDVASNDFSGTIPSSIFVAFTRLTYVVHMCD
jgi:hypothetical protein